MIAQLQWLVAIFLWGTHWYLYTQAQQNCFFPPLPAEPFMIRLCVGFAAKREASLWLTWIERRLTPFTVVGGVCGLSSELHTVPLGWYLLKWQLGSFEQHLVNAEICACCESFPQMLDVTVEEEREGGALSQCSGSPEEQWGFLRSAPMWCNSAPYVTLFKTPAHIVLNLFSPPLSAISSHATFFGDSANKISESITPGSVWYQGKVMRVVVFEDNYTKGNMTVVKLHLHLYTCLFSSVCILPDYEVTNCYHISCYSADFPIAKDVTKS